MTSFNQSWENIQNSATFNKAVKWGSLALLLLILFFSIKSCSAYISPKETTYRIAKDPTWYPLPLYGNESNLSAFSNELLFAIARDQGLKIELTSTSHQMLFEKLDDGGVQGVLSSLNPDVSSREFYDFSDPYYLFGAVLVVPKESEVATLDDLAHKSIAVKRGSPILFQPPIAPSSFITPYDSPTLILDQLARDKIDAVVMDQFSAYFFLKEFYREKLKVANLPMTLDGLRLITGKTESDNELVQKFNAGLKRIKEDGTYLELLNKWDLHDPESL